MLGDAGGYLNAVCESVARKSVNGNENASAKTIRCINRSRIWQGRKDEHVLFGWLASDNATPVRQFASRTNPSRGGSDGFVSWRAPDPSAPKNWSDDM